MRAVRSGLAVALTTIFLAACQDDAGTPAAENPAADPTSDSSSTASAPTSTTAPGRELAYQAGGSIWIQAPGEAEFNGAPGVQTDNQHPAWSPDGTQIAFEANFNKIWTVDRDGTGEQEQFTCEAQCAAVYEPAWSPDGSTLAFVHILGDGTHTLASQLMTLDLETGDTTVIHEDTAGEVWEYTPRWSGDGTHVVLEHDVFASNLLDEDQTLSTDLRVVDTATGATTKIPGTDGAEFPDWSPTEALIVYSDGANLFTIHTDGSDKKRLTRFKVKTESAIQPTFTPDGASVIFTWVQGEKDSGTESTVPGILDLSDGTITAIEEARGASHARVRP